MCVACAPAFTMAHSNTPRAVIMNKNLNNLATRNILKCQAEIVGILLHAVWIPGCSNGNAALSNLLYIPVVPHKAVAEVSKIGNV